MWELPLSLGCKPEMSSSEKVSGARLLMADDRVPRCEDKGNEPPQLSISGEQRRHLSASISMRLEELHKNLVADHEQILELRGPAGLDRLACVPASGRKLPGIPATGLLIPSSQGLKEENSVITQYMQTARGKPAQVRHHYLETAYDSLHRDVRQDSKGSRQDSKDSRQDSKHSRQDSKESRQDSAGEMDDERQDSKESRQSVRRNSGLFANSDTDAIKEKVRIRKLRPCPYNVQDLYWDTGFFQWLAKHPIFENVTLGIIMVNALWLAVDTDGNTAATLLDAHAIYVFADFIFFLYFVMELFVRFMAFERKCKATRDGWFVFDSCLVTLYAFDPFVMTLMAILQGSGSGPEFPTAVLRLIRLARLSRAMRIVRMLRSLPELMIMIKGMMSAAASVGYTLFLLVMITYIFSIALRNMVPVDSDEDAIYNLYFSTVPEAMHNLIVYATFLDDLSEFILTIKDQSPVCFILTWLYISLASLTVMNMLIGVLCEVVGGIAEEERQSKIIDMVHQKFGDIVEQLDKNKDGLLSWQEFKVIVESEEAVRACESVNIDPESLVDMAEDFFFEDSAPVVVSFGEFMEMMLDLRGGQQATVKDIMCLRKGVNKKIMKLLDKMDRIATSICGIHGAPTGNSMNEQQEIGDLFGDFFSPSQADATQQDEQEVKVTVSDGYCCKNSTRTFTHVCRVAGPCGACGEMIRNVRAAHYECECCGTLPYCEKCDGGTDPDLVRIMYLRRMSAIDCRK